MDPEPPLYFLNLTFVLISFSGILILLFGLFLLLICSALISGSEVAFFSLSPNDLENLKNEEGKKNKLILKLRNKPRKLLATILISNNFINIAIVVLSDYLIKNLLGEEKLLSWGQYLSDSISGLLNPSTIALVIHGSIAVVGVTFLLVLFGEVAPKVYANINNLKFANFMVRPMNILSSVFGPASALLVNWSSKMESQFIYQRSGIENTSKDDLDKAIQLTVDNEEDSDEADILRGILKFGNVAAKQIMKSRVDVVALDITANYGEVMTTIIESGFSRIPVYKEDFDEIVGILYVKDLLGFAKEDTNFDWQVFVRDSVLYVPESKKIDDLLKEFQQKRTHIGIVVDEFGGSAGIVTLEDIMEEVIGEIKDEFDEDEEVDYIKINASNYIFEGKTMLNDVARIIGVDKGVFDGTKGETDSLAGLLLQNFGHIPKKDREITIGKFKFKIVSVTKRRIEKIHLTIL